MALTHKLTTHICACFTYIHIHTQHTGASVDWSREAFTMDDNLSAAVKEAFVQMHGNVSSVLWWIVIHIYILHIVTLLHCYIVTLINCYIVTLSHCHIIRYSRVQYAYHTCHAYHTCIHVMHIMHTCHTRMSYVHVIHCVSRHA